MTDTTAAANTEPDRTFHLFAAFRTSSTHPVVFDGRDVPGSVQELEDVTNLVEDESVTLRSWYDISGFRSDADLLVWLHGSEPDDLQWALRQLRRTAILQPLIRTWSTIGIAGTVDADVQGWLCVVPSSAGDPLVLDPIEADEVDDLRSLQLQRIDAAPRHAAGPDAIPFIGRQIEPAEIIEVLQ